MAFTCCHVLIGSCRALSPLNAASQNTTQHEHGDHNRQVEISLSAHVSSHLLQSFGDRGDHVVFEEALHEFQSPKPVSSVSCVDHASEAGVPILLAGKGSTHAGVELPDKPVQPEMKNSSSDPSAKGCSKYESGDAGQTLSDHTTLNTLPTSVSSTDKRLHWETLFMPYRRKFDTAGAGQCVPVAVTKETRKQTPMTLATLHEGFSEMSVTRHYSESDIIGPDFADTTLVDNTSLWVMLCGISIIA